MTDPLVSEALLGRAAIVLRRLAPGIALAAAVAVVAVAAAPLVARLAPIPAMVIALIIGIALNPIAKRSAFQPGIVFCVKTLLRWVDRAARDSLIKGPAARGANRLRLHLSHVNSKLP